MSLTSEFSPTNQAMTYLNLASAIELDAEDTVSKLLGVFSLFTDLSVLDNSYDISERLSEFHTQFGSDFTMCMCDGDILRFNIDPTDWSLNNVDMSGNVISTLIRRGEKLADFELDAESIKTPGRLYTWTPAQILSSLSQQIKSATIVKRLSNVAQKDNVSILDVESVLSSVNINDDPQLFSFANAIRDIGGNLSGSSITAALQKIYDGYGHATANNDTIEFDNTDWSIKSFNGTVAMQAFSTGIQFLGSVLLIVGGPIVKILSLVGMAATSVVQNIIQLINDKETAQINFDAKNYEYAVPIIQTTQGKTSFSQAIQDQVDSDKICLIQNMYGNWYIWDAGDGINYRVSLYVNLLNDYPVFDDFTGGGGFSTRKLCESVSIQSLPGSSAYYRWLRVWNGPLTTDSTQKFNMTGWYGFVSGDLRKYPVKDCFIQLTSNDDEDARKKVCYALLDSMLFFQQNTTLDNTEDDYSLEFEMGDAERTLLQWGDWWIGQIPDSGLDANPPLYFTYALVGLLAYKNAGKALYWSTINNKIIPAYNMMFQYCFWNTAMFARAFKSDTYPSLYGSAKTLLKVSYFRESYLIVPPKYEPNTILSAVITGLLAAAAVTATVIVAKRVINRKITAHMFTKYAAIQQEFDALKAADPTTDQYKINRSKYLKDVRKYNFMAGVLGQSSLSAMSGWETGESTVSSAYSACTGSTSSVVPLLESLSGTAQQSDMITNQDIKKFINQLHNLITGEN